MIRAGYPDDAPIRPVPVPPPTGPDLPGPTWPGPGITATATLPAPTIRLCPVDSQPASAAYVAVTGEACCSAVCRDAVDYWCPDCGDDVRDCGGPGGRNLLASDWSGPAVAA